MDSTIRIETQRNEHHVTVKVCGELDLVNAVRLDSHTLFRGLEDGTRVHVDLTGLTYIDSTGLAHLVQLQRAATQLGLCMVVYVTEENLVHRVIRLIGANDVLTVVPLPSTECPGLASEVGTEN